MSYEFQAIFSAIRLTIGFLFVFGFVTPLFFRYIAEKRGIERIVLSWVGLGGLLVTGIFILVSIHIYDFISIVFFLLMLPMLVHFFKQTFEGNSITDIFTTAEHNIVAKNVQFVERIKQFSRADFKHFVKDKIKIQRQNPYTFAAVGVATAGALLRILPSIQNSSPFSRLWYFDLDAVKSLSLQQYFSGYPAPKGMHSIIHFFSTITQVSPEMILHLIGGLISFFLSIIIFWVIKDITKGAYPSVAIFGTMVYALFPTMFLPVSMELETELSSLSMAICFALPTMILFLKNIRSGGGTPWFYIFMGIIATGLTDTFVFLMVLIPFLIIGLLSIPRKNFFAIFWRTSLKLISVILLTLAPFVIYCLMEGISVYSFFQDQLFNTQVFSFAPNLIMPIQDLSQIYLFYGVFLLAAYLIRHFVYNKRRIGDETVFILYFILLSFIYTPFFEYQYILIDPDQLNSFYGVMISIMAGLSLYSLFKFFGWFIPVTKKVLPYAVPLSVVLLAAGIIYAQDGFEKSRILPKTQPNGFFDAYYQIINERVPYTYATVGPELDRELSVNRHFFMNYQFFLNNYGAIDSLYQQYLTVPAEQRTDVEEVPPASIFIFVEKPPYGSIQQGILYDAQGTMRDLEQWLNSFQDLEGRTLEVYHETEQTVIYEIVNREGESTIDGVLRNIYPENEGRAARLFK